MGWKIFNKYKTENLVNSRTQFGGITRCEEIVKIICDNFHKNEVLLSSGATTLCRRWDWR